LNMNRLAPIGRIAPALVAAAFSALLLAGCDGGESMTKLNTEGDARRVSDVVEQFDESRMDEKRSQSLFARDAMPKGAEFKKYGQSWSFPTGAARADGDTATMEITVRNEKTGEGAGKVEWTFKKEGDAWKIATAPLP